MIIAKDIIQGTEEWKKEKSGIPSASSFDKIVTTKGDRSKQYLKYLYTLAAERVTGAKEETYQNKAMERGVELEAQARQSYEFISSYTVEQVGFCYQDERKLWGCSPDGLVGKDGLVEIKCPTATVHDGYLLGGEFPIDYFQQIQGQLLITGRKWCDFFSFYPGLKPLLIKVMPDKKFLDALKSELAAFCVELEKITEAIR